jgi:hypothetical protein
VEVTRSWFIDAWAVRDGVAFASLRSEHDIDAVNTVFLSVPALEPIPVGRISTALRATRGSFQAGFRDAENHEIAFDNLTQIRELIRRGYLASGIGPGGVAAVAPVGPPPEPGGPGGAHYEYAISDMELARHRWVGGDGPAASLTQVVLGQLGQVARMVMAFAEATVVEWEHALRRRPDGDGPEERRSLYQGMRGLHDWYWALVSRGIWRDLDELDAFASSYQLPLGRQLSGRAQGRRFVFGERQWDRSEQELLTMAPCPLLRDGDQRPRRLSDRLFLAMTDSDYFWDNRDYVELAPIALMAMLSAPADRYVPAGVEPEIEFQDRLRDSLEWLARELPSVRLPEAAEQLLNEYAQNMLEP